MENRKYELKVEILEKQCQEKDNEIESLNKVSIVKQLDKQLKRRNSQINILEKQLELSKKRCKNLENKKNNDIEVETYEDKKETVKEDQSEETENENEKEIEIEIETETETENKKVFEEFPKEVSEVNEEIEINKEESTEEEEDEEEEDEEDELSLVKKKIKKVYYYLDINTNNVYEIADDDELGDLLGVYDKKKRKIIKS